MGSGNIGLVGLKCGMTRVFQEDGSSIPVTVILVEPNKVIQIKTKATDGYNAVQVTTGSCKIKKVTKALSGHYAKANVVPGRGLWEFVLPEEHLGQLKIGDEIKLSTFKVGQKVDIIGTSKGKGFAGTHKRYHFSLQYASHGNSLSHRAPGSIGQNQTPGRVLKGKKMAGHMGDRQVTMQSLKIIEIDEQRNVLLVQGAVPGAVNGDLIINPSTRK